MEGGREGGGSEGGRRDGGRKEGGGVRAGMREKERTAKILAPAAPSNLPHP